MQGRTQAQGKDVECMHCGAVDDNHGVRVRVRKSSNDTHSTVCNVCVPKN